jgi:DNA-binding LacI/PurR family transcriptional regulator
MTTDVPPARRAPTLEHVARLAGVSRATVSRVINGVRNVDPQIAQVVQKAIDEVGYVPNRAARSLVTGRTFSVALVVSAPDGYTFDDPFLGPFGDPFFGRIASGALAELSSRGVHLILMRVNTSRSREQLLAHLRQGDIDGVMLVSVGVNDPLPQTLTDAGVAVVLFGRPPHSLPITHVDADQRVGAKLAATHLVARGCRDHRTQPQAPTDCRASATR